MSRRQRHLTLRPLPGAALQLDSRVVAESVGSTVQTWPDRSGLSRNPTQATAGNRASVVIGESGQKCLSFDGARYYQIPSSTGLFNGLHNGSESLVYSVARPATAAAPSPEAGYIICGNNRATSANIGITLMWENRTVVPGTAAPRGLISRGVNQFFAAQSAISNQWPGNTWRVMRTTFDADASASSRITFRVAGQTPVGNNTLTDAPTTFNATLDMCIGSAAADLPTVQFVGLMGAIIMFPAHSLSAAMQRRIDHALASSFKLSCA